MNTKPSRWLAKYCIIVCLNNTRCVKRMSLSGDGLGERLVSPKPLAQPFPRTRTQNPLQAEKCHLPNGIITWATYTKVPLYTRRGLQFHCVTRNGC